MDTQVTNTGHYLGWQIGGKRPSVTPDFSGLGPRSRASAHAHSLSLNFHSPCRACLASSCAAVARAGLPLPRPQSRLAIRRAKLHVIKSVHVDYRVQRAIDQACGDRHHAAGQADVKICSSRPKPISVYLEGVSDLQKEAAIWMRGPDCPVLCA